MTVGVLFGGRSYEHDISVITAVQTVSVLKKLHKVVPLYSKDGNLYVVKDMTDISAFAHGKVRKKRCGFVRGGVKVGHKKVRLDCVLMCCHGGEGEDGTFSGVMQYYDLPYTCCDVATSAITMDKKLSKCAFKAIKVPCAKGVVMKKGGQREHNLEYPLIVKPLHLGSSIGIRLAHDAAELQDALDVGFEFDDEVLVEQVITDMCELNCAAIYSCGKIEVSAVEMPASWHEFLTFEDKYTSGKVKSAAPKTIDAGLEERVKICTERIYRELGLFGVVRIDYMYSADKDTLYVNEINSQPGSLAYYLFERVGISFVELLEKMITEGIKRFDSKRIKTFYSGVLDKISSSHTK